MPVTLPLNSQVLPNSHTNSEKKLREFKQFAQHLGIMLKIKLKYLWYQKSVILNVASVPNSSLFFTGGTVPDTGKELKTEQEKDPENKLFWETETNVQASE